LLIIASVIAAMALINAILPAISKSSGALVTANSAAADRIRTDIEIVHVASDTSSGTEDQIIVWVKNIGVNKIAPIEAGDIFLTTPSGVKHLSYGAGPTPEYWDYTIENGAEWTRTVTVRMTLHLTDSSVTAGGYNVTVNVYNSVNASKDFSV
jgi:flagellar protein FlaG